LGLRFESETCLKDFQCVLRIIDELKKIQVLAAYRSMSNERPEFEHLFPEH